MNYRAIADQSWASQDKFELWQLLKILHLYQPRNILEVGVHRGGMIAVLRECFPQATIVGVDNNLEPLEFDAFFPILGDSHSIEIRDQVIRQFKNQIDFLFIDGDHTYEGAMLDWEFYSPMVRSGGVIGFHDIMRMPGQIKGVEVRKLFDELKQKFASIEIWNGTAGPNGPGTGLLFV